MTNVRLSTKGRMIMNAPLTKLLLCCCLVGASPTLARHSTSGEDVSASVETVTESENSQSSPSCRCQGHCHLFDRVLKLPADLRTCFLQALEREMDTLSVYQANGRKKKYLFDPANPSNLAHFLHSIQKAKLQCLSTCEKSSFQATNDKQGDDSPCVKKAHN